MTDLGLLPVRPDYGDQGVQKNVPLRANYYQMTLQNPDLVLYFYEMTFEAFPAKGSPEPEKEMTVPEGKKLMQIIRCALRLSTFDDVKSDIATDFGKTLISTKKLENSQLQTGQFKFWAENEIQNGVPSPRTKAIRFRMTLNLRDKGGLRASKLLGYLASSNKIEGAYESVLPMVQALDIILGHSAKLSLETVTPKQGKCFPLKDRETFKLEGPKGTKGYLEGVRGYFASVRATTNRLLVNCNACCGAFYKAVPLVELFRMFIGDQHPTPEQQKRLEKAIQGLRVELIHIQDKRTVRTVFGLAHPYDGPRKINFFHEKDNKTYTVAEYWTKKRYEPIRNFNYPVVNVGNKDHPTLVPPHVCNIIPGQMAKRKLDSVQTADMIKNAILSPEKTRDSINTNAFNVLGLKDNSTLNSFGLSLSSDMVTLQGRVLDQPAVIYQTGSKPVRLDWMARWNLRDGAQVYRPGHLQNWGVLRITRDAKGLKDEQEKKLFGKSFAAFFGTLKKTLGTEQVDDPIDLGKHFLDPRESGNEGPFQEMFKLCDRREVGFLVIVLPDNDTSTYKQIKRIGDTVWGISTVCVLGDGRKFYKDVSKAGQYFTNVALKINLKLKGINHVLRDQPKLYESTMVIGIDVTHPSPGLTKRTAPSVAAMVASTDEELAQWPVDLRINTAGKEMVDLLGPMLETRLTLWKSKHGNSLPDNLLIYRDGVSEGQYKAVLKEELEPLRNTCKVMYKGRGLPKITLIIVGKRHHTRFFKKEKEGGCTNPAFGTVVDTGVTEARNWDFFLQSHHALQGTARPAHYFVLLNEIFTQEFVGPGCKVSDYVQKLTYDMCYLFGRSTGPVSIPPPVYYADLACERSRCYGDFDDDFSDTSSMTGGDRGNGPGQQVPHRPGPSKPGPSKSTPNKQGSGSKGSSKPGDSSKNQSQPTVGKTPDMMAGLTKKERARLVDERMAANQKGTSGGSSKTEGKKPEAKVEAKPEAKSKAKTEGKADEEAPEGKGKAKGGAEKPKEAVGLSKAEGKKPDTKGQGQKPGTQTEEKQPKDKERVEIDFKIKDTMFYI